MTNQTAVPPLRQKVRITSHHRCRRSNTARTTEIRTTVVDGETYISGTPNASQPGVERHPRDWLANLVATPEFIVRLKISVHVDLPATARRVNDPAERRRVLAAPNTEYYRNPVSSEAATATFRWCRCTSRATPPGWRPPSAPNRPRPESAAGPSGVYRQPALVGVSLPTPERMARTFPRRGPLPRELRVRRRLPRQRRSPLRRGSGSPRGRRPPQTAGRPFQLVGDVSIANRGMLLTRSISPLTRRRIHSLTVTPSASANSFTASIVASWKWIGTASFMRVGRGGGTIGPSPIRWF